MNHPKHGSRWGRPSLEEGLRRRLSPRCTEMRLLVMKPPWNELSLYLGARA